MCCFDHHAICKVTTDLSNQINKVKFIKNKYMDIVHKCST